MLKITPSQAESVHRLVKELCANCDEDGNCISTPLCAADSNLRHLLQLFQKCGFTGR